LAEPCGSGLSPALLEELRLLVARHSEEGHECQRQLEEVTELSYSDAYSSIAYALMVVPGVSSEMTETHGADWGRRLFGATCAETGKDLDVSLMEAACLNSLRHEVINLANQQLAHPEARAAAEATARDTQLFLGAMAEAAGNGDQQEVEFIAENYGTELVKNLEAQLAAMGYPIPEGLERIPREALAHVAKGFVNILADTRFPPMVPMEPGFEPKFVEFDEASDDDYHANPGDADDAVTEQADD